MSEAKTLSEAYLAVREFLWDGTGTLNICSESISICGAAQEAFNRKKISYSHMWEIRNHIHDLLDGYHTVSSFLLNEYGVSREENKQRIQEYRHAWLVHLSQEAENGKSNL